MAEEKIETIEQKNSEISEGRQEVQPVDIVEQAREERKKLEAMFAKIQEEKIQVERLKAELALGGRSMGGTAKAKSDAEIQAEKDKAKADEMVARFYK